MEYNLIDGTSDIWLCSLSALFDTQDAFFSQLSVEEQNRAERFKFSLHRARFIASHGFTRSVLSNYLKIDKQAIRYKKGAYGKPYLADKNCYNLQFNLTHTENIALLAISRGVELGVDIEYKERKTDWQGIVKRFFAPDEQQALFLLPEDQQRDVFFQLWTRKEAYMKVLGTGLSLAPTEFSLTVPPEEAALVKHHSTKYPTLENVSFSTLNMPPQFKHYCATLAVAVKTCNYNLYLFSESD